MLTIYPACFFKEYDGRYTVVFPDLNWLATQGDDLEDAIAMAVDCLAGYIYTCKRDGDIIPAPSKLDNVDPKAIAKELDPDYSDCEMFVNMVSVDVELYAKEHFEKAVKKTLTIPAWLNAMAVEQKINFSKVLQEGLKRELKIV